MFCNSGILFLIVLGGKESYQLIQFNNTLIIPQGAITMRLNNNNDDEEL